MFDKGAEIVPGMTVLHDDGLSYQVDRVEMCSDGYESWRKLSGHLRVSYTQLESGDYPAGTGWNKAEHEFRHYFTPVASAE